MSIAELFYAKQAKRAQRFPVPRRRKAPRGRHPLAPQHRKFLLEPLEPRLLLDALGFDPKPVLFIPGFGGTSAADTTDAGIQEWLTTRGLAEEVRALLSRAREVGLDPDQLGALAHREGRADWAALAAFYVEYLDVLDAQGALDFAELVHRAVLVAEAQREALRDRYDRARRPSLRQG